MAENRQAWPRARRKAGRGRWSMEAPRDDLSRLRRERYVGVRYMGTSVRISYLGYGLLEAWAICVFFIQDGSSLLGNLSIGFPLLNLASSLAVVMGTLLIVVVSHRRHEVAHRGAVSLGVGLANALGTSLALFWSHPLASLVGLVLASFANAWLWVSWGDIYSALDTEAGERTAIASATAQALVIAVVLSMPAAARSIVLVMLAPTASIMYLLAFKRAARLSDGKTDRAEHAPVNFDLSYMARMSIGLGGPIAVLYYLIEYHVVLPGMSTGLDAALLAGLLLFIVALAGFVRFSVGFSIGSICKMISTFLVATIVVCGLGLSSSLANAAAFSLMLLCQYLLILYAARLVGQGFGNVTFTFGVVWLINHACGLLGSAFGFLAVDVSSGLDSFGSASLIILLALLFVLGVTTSHEPHGTDAGEAPSVSGGDSSSNLEAEDDQNRFEERLLEVARKHALSPRETEIFALLVKGRSAPFIRDELVISLNTVTSHIKHIYAKLGVHTRQQLIDAVEGDDVRPARDALSRSDGEA